MKENARGARARGKSLKDASEELGIDVRNLREHDRAGRVVRYSDRSVDVESTRTRIDCLRDPRGGKREPREETGPLEVAELGTVAELAARIVELAGLSDTDRRKRLDIAKVLLTEQQAEGERLKVERMRGDSVPKEDAFQVVRSAGKMFQAVCDADVEAAAVGLNGKWNIAMSDAREFMRERYRAIQERCAEKAMAGELE